MNEMLSNGPLLATVTDSELPANEQSTSNGLTQHKSESLELSGATGPRTLLGKEKSAFNALKFGIFSKVAILPSESQMEFEDLLDGLRDYFQPEGKLEHTLVEKLAVDWWRYRRFLIAEGAEIRAKAEFVDWDRREYNRQDAAGLPQLSCNGGLIRWIENPQALQGCLDLLDKLKNTLKHYNYFDRDRDDAFVLTQLYGSRKKEDESWEKTLFDSYLALSNDDKNVNVFLEEIEKEKERLRRYKEEHRQIASAKLKLEPLRRSIPEAPALDRLLRYEAAISRDIDRTLNQIERLQRMRRGQPVPPSINVNINSAKE